MAPAPVTKRITTEAKAALKQVFDDLNIPRNKLYCAATLPTEIREVAQEHTLVYSQIARQLSNWKDKKYNFAGKIYSRDPAEIMQVLGDYLPGDNTQFVIDTISKRMIYEKGNDVCFANSYNAYEKNQLQLAALVNGNEHDDVTSFLANFVGHYATLAVEVFPKKAEMLRDAEFDFTQRRLSAVGERKSDFIQLPSLQSYDKRERALVWMKIEAVLFKSWTLHHYDGRKPQIIIDLDDCTVHSYSRATLYYVGGWILHQLFTAVEKTNKKDKATEIFMQQFAMNSTISEVEAETLKLPTSVLNRREQVHLRRPSATFFKFVECLEFIYVENVTVKMMIAYAAGDILQAIADAICASEEVKVKFRELLCRGDDSADDEGVSEPGSEQETRDILAFVISKFRHMRGRALQKSINGQTCKGADAVGRMTTRDNVAAKAAASSAAATAVRKEKKEKALNATAAVDNRMQDNGDEPVNAMDKFYLRMENALPTFEEADMEAQQDDGEATGPTGLEGCIE